MLVSMSATCPSCHADLEAEWVACPHCGRPVAGQVDSEKLVRLVTKVGMDLLEVGLLEAESGATKKGNPTRAQQFAIARNLAKDVAPKIADAVTTYVYQKKVLNGGSAHRTPSDGKGGKAT
jgi:hypothetical protein